MSLPPPDVDSLHNQPWSLSFFYPDFAFQSWPICSDLFFFFFCSRPFSKVPEKTILWAVKYKSVNNMLRTAFSPVTLRIPGMYRWEEAMPVAYMQKEDEWEPGFLSCLQLCLPRLLSPSAAQHVRVFGLGSLWAGQSEYPVSQMLFWEGQLLTGRKTSWRELPTGGWCFLKD